MYCEYKVQLRKLIELITYEPHKKLNYGNKSVKSEVPHARILLGRCYQIE